MDVEEEPRLHFGGEFGRRLDLWGSYHRMALAVLGSVIVWALIPESLWALRLCLAYLGLSLFVPWLVGENRSERQRAVARTGLMLVDVMTVTVLAHGWGTHTSPVALMYLPIVVGWTLVPQRGLGSASLVVIALVVAAVLLAEQLGYLPRAPLAAPAVSGGRARPWVFFILLISALAVVHAVLNFTVIQLLKQARKVGELLTERELRTQEQRWAEQLQEAARLEALGRLSGGVAHDFNNLLTALMGYAELARLKLHHDRPFVAKALRDIEQAAERGQGLTAQLLEFASRRPEAPEPVDLSRAVGRSKALLSGFLRSTVSLKLSLCERSCTVLIDPTSFERVLLNLVVNACDAMPGGGVLSLTVQRVRTARDEAVQLLVEDEGSGIAASDLPRIFEPFFTRKGPTKGTGLGLASVYGIVRQSAGEISVSSVEGKGTCFCVTWPLHGGVESGPEPEVDSEVQGGTEHLMLVDDDALVLAVVTEQLRSAGYRVTSHQDPALALRDLRTQPQRHALLITDVLMPQLAGSDLAQRAREVAPGLPIVFISGYTGAVMHDQLGALSRFMLSKPFTQQKLLDAVRRALDSARPPPLTLQNQVQAAARGAAQPTAQVEETHRSPPP